MTYEVGFSDIAFPVYKIGKTDPNHDNGVSFYLMGKDTAYSDVEYKVLVIDDKNRPEPTLAMRRLMLRNDGIKLYNISKAIFFLGDLVKLAVSKTWFIDKNGKFFQYKKSCKVPLVYKRITKVMPILTGGAIIEAEGMSQRFKVLFAPTREMRYAGLLIMGKTVILYGLYDQEYKSTTRKI